MELFRYHKENHLFHCDIKVSENREYVKLLSFFDLKNHFCVFFLAKSVKLW